jgi:hypothetical protein
MVVVEEEYEFPVPRFGGVSKFWREASASENRFPIGLS